MKKWTEQDNKRAARQGWIIQMAAFLDRDVPTIQRVDDPGAWGRLPSPHNTPRFGSDKEAESYVCGRADAGCTLARKALRYATGYRSIGRASNWNDLRAVKS